VAEFVGAMRDGHPGAAAAMECVTRDLSLLVQHAVNLLEPGRLVIESDVPELGEEFGSRLRRELEQHPLQGTRGATEIVISEIGEFGGVRGAIVPALKRMFKIPTWA
jgi:predicted NBD/HSP70 family sugar kinase